MSDSSHPLDGLAGSILAEKYRLTSLLGSGGMGYVYEAEQLGLGRSVALKLLRRELIETRFEWFRAEALAASRINHPHAVAIYDFGVTGDGIPYLVMEHLRGLTLSALIEREPLSPERVVTLGAQILSALDEAHACGVVHCDLTGDNVLVERLRDGEDFAKVIDFGLARLFDAPSGTPRVAGTAEYMAPEQIRGEPIDPRTDLYAMGVLLYEMIVGRTPFAGGSVAAVLEGHLETAPDGPHAVIPTCPRALSDVALWALAKPPSDRPPSAAVMRERLLASLPGMRRRPPTARSDARTTRLGLGGDGRISRPHQPPPPAPRTTRLTCELGQLGRSLVGREPELDRLLAFCRGEGAAGALTLVGPRGIGKGRLTTEAARRLEGEVAFFAGGADPSGLKTSWYPILAVLEPLLRLEGPPTYESLSVAAARCGLPDRDVPGLAEIFAIEGPANRLELAVRRREAHAAAMRTLLSVQRRFPRAVLCFADVDRYDHPSRRILRELAGRVDPARLRIVVTGQRSPDLEVEPVEIVELDGLPPQHARELAALLAGPAHDVPDALAIHAITGGSPTAVEQVAGWIQLGNSTADVPSSLVDLVSVRVNRLPAPARRVLQAVAAHGTVAPRWLVDAMLGGDEMRALDDALWTGLLVVETDALTIPSDLVASVITACTPADVRRRLHRRALEALGDSGAPGIRGHHAEHAGEIGRAYQLFVSAGDDAVRRFDDPGAAVWYGRAVATARELHGRGCPDAAGQLVDASVLLAEVLRQSGERRLAVGVLDEAELFQPTDRQRAMLSRSRGVIARAEGDTKTAARMLQLAIGDGMRSGERNFLCQCYLDLVRVLDDDGRMREATAELEQAVDVITMGEGLRSTAAPPRLWRLGMTLAERKLRAGEAAKAKEIALAASAWATRVGNAHARGRIAALLARACESLGERGPALRHRANAIDAMRQLGDRRSTAELLIATARATRRASSEPGRTDASWSASPEQSLRLAGRLASEIGWDEGVALSRTAAE